MLFRLPLINQIASLQGIEFVAVLFFIVIGYFCAGFLLDYFMKKQGFGPYLNGALALAGAYLAVWLKWTVFPHRAALDPLLTLSLIMATILVLVLGLAAVRNRIA